MKNDLISRSALIATIRPDADEDTKAVVLLSDVKALFRNAISNAPAVDAVEVVRCKDCEYSFRNRAHKKDACPIRDANIWLGGDGFCSLGVRRADDGK